MSALTALQQASRFHRLVVGAVASGAGETIRLSRGHQVVPTSVLVGELVLELKH